jgi:hypothetical protein
MIEDAAYEVATQVRTVEDTIDCVLGELAELQARILRANSVAAVGPAVIHNALERLSAGMAGLVTARGHIVGCHAALADAKEKTPGLRTVSWGDGDNKCPPSTGQADLRIVA